jgi:hypothetical protein
MKLIQQRAGTCRTAVPGDKHRRHRDVVSHASRCLFSSVKVTSRCSNAIFTTGRTRTAMMTINPGSMRTNIHAARCVERPAGSASINFINRARNQRQQLIVPRVTGQFGKTHATFLSKNQPCILTKSDRKDGFDHIGNTRLLARHFSADRRWQT